MNSLYRRKKNINCCCYFSFSHLVLSLHFENENLLYIVCIYIDAMEINLKKKTYSERNKRERKKGKEMMNGIALSFFAETPFISSVPYTTIILFHLTFSSSFSYFFGCVYIKVCRKDGTELRFYCNYY